MVVLVRGHVCAATHNRQDYSTLRDLRGKGPEHNLYGNRRATGWRPPISRRATTGNGFLDIIIADSDIEEERLGSIVNLEKNQELIKDGAHVQHMYFPIDALISLRCDLESGYTAEFGQIGREGFVGFSALMGNVTTQNTAIVQTEGRAYRISSEAIQTIFDTSPRFRRVTLQYMQALMQEAAQSVICNRFHSITQQFCRSLLLAADRLGSETVALTHEQLAVAIGCRREAVSLAARKLQSEGLIRYAYGHIVIVDRPALEARSCECYGTVRLGFAMFFHVDQSDSTDTNIEGA